MFLFIIAVSILPLAAETTVTIPVPEQVTDEAKNLVLTITVPTELERVERPSRDVKIKKRKTNYRKYFDFNPFPGLVNPTDPDIVVRFGKMVAKDPSLRNILKARNLHSAHEIARNIAHITTDFLGQTVDEMISKGVTRGAINEFITVYDNYPRHLRIFSVGRKEREEMVKIARKLSFTDGEIQVVKVETNDIGSTVIQLTVGGKGDQYKPQYVNRLEKGKIDELKMPDNTEQGGYKKADELTFDENPTSGNAGQGGDKPPEEFFDIFE
jgi:hypothetical protein